jgi:hypothetical protein
MQNERATVGETAMISLNIDSLSEDELIELNHKVVARLRFLSQMRSHNKMLGFRIGERVTFRPGEGSDVTGILTRYNKKTVTVIADSGEHWNVAPGLLNKVESEATETTQNKGIKLVPLPHRTGRR